MLHVCCSEQICDMKASCIQSGSQHSASAFVCEQLETIAIDHETSVLPTTQHHPPVYVHSTQETSHFVPFPINQHETHAHYFLAIAHGTSYQGT